MAKDKFKGEILAAAAVVATEARAKADLSAAAPNDVHIVGLVKAGRLRYSLVTGTLANPIIDPTPDPLEHTRQRMELEIRKLVQTIP